MPTGEYESQFTGGQIDARLAEIPTIVQSLAQKYQKPSGGIPKSDLSDSVQNSIDNADTAYQKPSSGIPKTDLASGVQDSLDNADASYHKPQGGIPKTDLASGVQNSLNKADTSYQKPVSGIPSSDMSSEVQASLGKADSAYKKPDGGIPKTDLASGVQSSLDKADSAVQDVSAKADKPSSANEGNLAKFNGSKNPVDSGIPADNVALKDGYYQTLVAGAAERLVQPKDISGAFFSRPSGGDAEISNGNAQFKGVEGNSVKVNQLVQNGDFADGDTNWRSLNGTMSVSGGIATAQGTASNSKVRQDNLISASMLNHKVLVRYSVKSSVATQVNIYCGGYADNVNINANTWVTLSVIKTITDVSAPELELYYNSSSAFGSSDTAQYKDINVIDLTAIFGAGNEPSTVAQVEEWLAENWGAQPYYDYNPGEVVNVNMKGIESIGRNLLDAETGKVQILGKYSDVYDSYYGIVGTHGAITFTDALGNTETITPDSDGKFLIETPGTLSVADAGADCSVFFWWDGSKTDYSAPQESVAHVDVTHIWSKKNGQGDLVRVWPTGMPGLGDLRDILGIEDGEVVARRKMQEVDLGTLSWNVSGKADNLFTCYIGATYPGYIRVMCGKYVSVYGVIANMNNHEISGYGTNLYIKDTAFSDAAAFKTAMSGVKLYYELDTEEVYTDLVYQGSEIFPDGTPVTLPVNYEVDNWGMENILPKNDSTIRTAKPTVTCKYSLDAVEMMDTMQTEIDNLDEGKADKEGDFPGIVAGSARTLTGDVPTGVEFTSQKTGNPNIVSDGIAVAKKYKGKTLAWNQLVKNGGFIEGATGWSAPGGTLDMSNNIGTYTITSVDSEFYNNAIIQGGQTIAGHKYYYHVEVMATKRIYLGGTFFGQQIVIPSSTSFSEYSGITTASTSESRASIYVCIASVETREVGDTFKVRNVIVTDLTLMFGAGNEPSSVAEFETLYPLPYYAYNAGALKNNAAKALKTVGFNQWDEQWEVVNSKLTSKNFIPVLPNTIYYFKAGAGNTWGEGILWYDANKEFIKVDYGVEGSYTSPTNAAFVKFRCLTTYGTTYNHDICINLSNAAKNGTYEPYQERVININLDEFDVRDSQGNVTTITGGLKSAGSVYDEISGGKYIKRIGSVDLGTLSGWNYAESASVGNITYLANAIQAKQSNNSIICICSKYVGVNANYFYGDGKTTDKIIGIEDGNIIRIHDFAHTSAPTSSDNWLSGVILYYELAEPEIYDLVNEIPMTYQEWGDGTETRLPVDTADSTLAPLAMDVVYPMDAVGTMQKMPQNYDTTASLDALASSIAATLSSALGGTFNITRGAYDETNQKYNWSSSFTPNS